VSLAYRRRVEESRDVAEPGQLDLGAIEASWGFSSAKRFPYSISPVEGFRGQIGLLREAEALGSDVSLTKLAGDLRFYTRVFAKTDALALRAGAGTTFGQEGFEQSYALGGFPDGSLLDVVRTNPAVLRGYPDNLFRGRRYVAGNAEYRFPLLHPQRGFRSYPIFLRHLHGSVFFDAGSAFSGDIDDAEWKTAAGAALGGDFVLGHRLPVTMNVGVAHGFDTGGETRVYFRAGLSF
jgi:outer membrane protein assembly factor BamA